jgi:hypothetical protein
MNKLQKISYLINSIINYSEQNKRFSVSMNDNIVIAINLNFDSKNRDKCYKELNILEKEFPVFKYKGYKIFTKTAMIDYFNYSDNLVALITDRKDIEYLQEYLFYSKFFKKNGIIINI